MALIKQDSLEHWIKNFYGYGSWNSKFWFVSLEEGGGELPEEVAEKIDAFSRLHFEVSEPTLCDIREQYKHMSMWSENRNASEFESKHEFRFGHQAKLNSTWKNLINFVSGYSNKVIDDPLDYQKKKFASPEDRNEALVRLLPLPSPHSHAWYYSWLDMPQLPYLKSRELYERQFFEARVHHILDQMRKHQPEMVLMYGMNNVTRLKNLFRQSFSDVTFKMVKAVPRQIPQHHLAKVDHSKIVITTQIPTLRHNRIETGFDWFQFGKICRETAS